MQENGYCSDAKRETVNNCEYYSDKNMCRNSLVPVWGFKPRGSLARALYEKQQHDDCMSQFDKNTWYQCDVRALPSDISSKFVQLAPDQATLEFLEQSEKKSDFIWMQLWRAILKAILGLFMTQTSINGWLQCGSMFVLSQSQLRKMLNVDNKWKANSLLDLGAGDGRVTEHLAPLFDRVYATEVSGTMQRLLQSKGYQLLDITTWHLDRKFDAISCLNLIDRCDKPLQMLHHIKSSLSPDGQLILAVVLPFSAYVESGSPNNKPSELLPITGATFENQVESFINDVLTPANFQVAAWSRVPYLCEGDLQQSYYWLDDAVFILKPVRN